MTIKQLYIRFLFRCCLCLRRKVRRDIRALQKEQQACRSEWRKEELRIAKKRDRIDALYAKAKALDGQRESKPAWTEGLSRLRLGQFSIVRKEAV